MHQNNNHHTQQGGDRPVSFGSRVRNALALLLRRRHIVAEIVLISRIDARGNLGGHCSIKGTPENVCRALSKAALHALSRLPREAQKVVVRDIVAGVNNNAENKETTR